jgi:hypothetical protein
MSVAGGPPATMAFRVRRILAARLVDLKFAAGTLVLVIPAVCACSLPVRARLLASNLTKARDGKGEVALSI